MNFEQFRQLRYHPENSGLDKDIIEHLTFLEELASQCDHVTEFGCNNCHSSTAFISGCKGKVISYDINHSQAVRELESMELPCEWKFVQHDTGDPELVIDDTDFLFIDSKHTYDHLKKELFIHPSRVHKYIGFHDTISHGEISSDGGSNLKGIMPAIREFLHDNYEWQIRNEFIHNNGMMIIERIKDASPI